jgi:hypothetical protein
MANAPFDAAPRPAENFRIGRVISRSLGILSGNFGKFFILACIPMLPILFLGLFVVGRPDTLNGLGANPSGAVVGATFGMGLLTAFLYIFSQAVVLYGAFQAMRNRSFAIGESLGVGFARFLPIIGLLFFMGLAVGISTLLLIVPGVIVYCMLFVALPVCVVERLGPFESMGRSATLTKGNRWRIFGLLFLLGLVSVIVEIVLQAVMIVVGGVVVGAIAVFLWKVIYSAFAAIATVGVYHDLRVAKEGIDIDRIAAVFD